MTTGAQRTAFWEGVPKDDAKSGYSQDQMLFISGMGEWGRMQNTKASHGRGAFSFRRFRQNTRRIG